MTIKKIIFGLVCVISGEASEPKFILETRGCSLCLGWYRLRSSSSGDDHRRADRRTAGRLPEDTQLNDHHERQETHELWR